MCHIKVYFKSFLFSFFGFEEIKMVRATNNGRLLAAMADAGVSTSNTGPLGRSQ